MSVAPYPWTIPGRILGIDVSNAQAPLPMDKIAAYGVRFVIVKATESLSGVDPRFPRHLSDALAAGMHAGSYQFIHSSEDGAKQAEHYWRTIEPYADRMRVRPAMDWEDNHRIGAIGPASALANALAFLRTIHRLSGRRPVVYTGPGFMALFRGLPKDELTPLAEYDLWVAHYRWDPNGGKDYGLVDPITPAPWTSKKLWQCGGNGAPRIPGVSVDLDLDVFFGDEAAFLAWCDDAPVRESGLILNDGGPPNDPYYVDRAEQDAAELADTDPAPPTTNNGEPNA